MYINMARAIGKNKNERERWRGREKERWGGGRYLMR